MFAIAFAFLTFLFFYVSWFFKRRYTFWRKLQVKYPQPVLIFGNIKDFFRGRKHLSLVYDDIYASFPHDAYVGIFELASPNLLIRDPKLANRILVNDFGAFRDRGLHVDEDLDPLNAHLVNLSGSRWKTTRSKLMPAFSAGKLKQMYPLIEDCVGMLENHLQGYVDSGHPADVKEIMAKFLTDVIGRCALGLECNALRDPNSEFRKVGRQIFAFTVNVMMRIVLRMINPKLLNWIRIKAVPVEVEKFFFGLLHDAIEHRKCGVDRKPDFLQLMIDIQERERKENKLKCEDLFSDTLLVANMFVFFAGGFETVASSLGFCLYELAVHPDLQTKLREEIRKASKSSALDYETVSVLPYLDMVLSETLRKYPPIPLAVRVCNQDYLIPGTSVVLKEGTRVTVPIYSLHHDPKFYENPKCFRPERFDNNAVPQAYLPFGDGPRICIGLRLAKIEMKCCLANILLKYSFETCSETEIPIQIKARSIFLNPRDGIRLTVKKIIED